MNASAKNMEVIYMAKQYHDAACPWRGQGKRIFMTPFDISRMGWEEGDVIAGLTLLSDAGLTTGRFRVECDEEPQAEPTIVKAVSNKELVSA